MEPFNNQGNNTNNNWKNSMNNNQQNNMSNINNNTWNNNQQGWINNNDFNNQDYINNQNYNNYYNNMNEQNFYQNNQNYNNYYNQNNPYNNGQYYNQNYNQNYDNNMQQQQQPQGMDKNTQKMLKKKQKEEIKKRKLAIKTAKETKGLDIKYNYDDLAQYEDITYEDVTRPPKMVNPKILTLCFLYMVFLTIGLFNTSFELGYKPQVIDVTIKSNRVIFEKCNKILNDLDKLEHFNGASELNEVYEKNSYQTRIPPLKSSLTKANKYLETLNTSSFRIKSDDYIKVEMLNIVTDILNQEIKILQKAIEYYEICTGYSPLSAEVQKTQSELLLQYDTYKKKLINGKSRFNAIKEQELKLYN